MALVTTPTSRPPAVSGVPAASGCAARRPTRPCARLLALTPGNSGNRLDAGVQRGSKMLRGWFEYFQHSRRRVFAEVDAFVRRRLRAILQRRNSSRSYGFGAAGANVRWPNAFFTNLGLFSTTAQALARRSR